MIRGVLLASLLLGGCVIGDQAEPDTDGGAADFRGGTVNGEVAADLLRWGRFSSDCTGGDNITTSGGSISVLFDVGKSWSNCTFSTTVTVPAGVRVTGVWQYVRGSTPPEGDGTMTFSGRVGTSSVVPRRFDAETGLDVAVGLNQLGASLCAKGGGTFQISFTAANTGGQAYFDSVDMELSAAACD